MWAFWGEMGDGWMEMDYSCGVGNGNGMRLVQIGGVVA